VRPWSPWFAYARSLRGVFEKEITTAPQFAPETKHVHEAAKQVPALPAA
jgi:hypothetical protein